MSELLKVLDMTELEQWEYLISRSRIREMCDNQLDSYCAAKYKRRVLATLAFRLRDEAVGVQIEGIVPNYFDEKTPRIPFKETLFRWYKARRLIDEKLKTHFYPGNTEAWWREQAQPIHWIVAALIAQEKTDGE